MSLGITINYPNRPNEYIEDIAVEFDDRFWWYLYPWINQYNNEFNEEIDLYSIYDVENKKIDPLIKILNDAFLKTGKESEILHVLTGTMIVDGHNKDIYFSKTRDEMLSFINKFLKICTKAIEMNAELRILGD